MYQINSTEPRSPYELSGIRILVVEDNPINTFALGAYLKRWGCVFDVASNGLEALQKLDSSFDLVLMDIHMPEMDGLEATRLLRLRGEILPIIALTADCTLDVQLDLYEGGFSAVQYKPIQPKNLLDLILHLRSHHPIGTLGIPDEIRPEQPAARLYLGGGATPAQARF
ncbi:hypothetical protein GCM10027275_50740 [Rhabdobacter roseus]|uniref:CheY-like chemotaxis protein n=1 Tax=Rhabdobacter roseus TaxID=1655419 RepID=A0A840U045_9BACT|nr:response regulator [Rhabdobacter roseus]MBB5287147.1 CheY-like chemotaxis protein [Rhabdobacter roseus]